MTDGDQGRTRRRRNPEQTRKAIIAGLLAAVHDGDFDPTTKTIAERAGVSERSIFVHFPTRNDLLVAAVEVQSDAVEAAIAQVDPAAPLPERITAVVRQSERIFALQREPRLIGLLESPGVPGLDARMRLTDKRIREGLARTFAPELAAATGREELLDLIDATAGWAYRHHLMDRRRLSERAASKAISRTLRALLGDGR
ncbi:TetR/AcrR family transcriptional regulator [Nocardia yamanashiensis]|uniref:TetR/AcrR family transcriptional regulator n=1 Tax=Nocardia yamanashiensis TaxID=209247 RepID=UPI001E404C63|nr:TetR/AcrR family transcriptional regulator [Nocardia yamanashiensis]UGT44988.1 TetR/AcrR family transcriptional regulator [Nocardia yamanashiensis]